MVVGSTFSRSDLKQHINGPAASQLAKPSVSQSVSKCLTTGTFFYGVIVYFGHFIFLLGCYRFYVLKIWQEEDEFITGELKSWCQNFAYYLWF